VATSDPLLVQPSSDATRGDAGAKGRSPRLLTIAISLGIALAIIAAAYVVSERAGITQLGQSGSGKNPQLLPKVGQTAPNFAAIDLNAGKIVHLSDFRGHPVWLMFWGSWCPPCRAETPDIQAAYAQLAPKGVILLAVSLNEAPQAAWDYAQRNHLTYQILSDPNGDGTQATYPIANFPTHIFIDASGTVRAVVLSPLDQPTAIKYADEILSPAPPAKH